ncbi:Glycoside hydrolase superfamily [Penicillium angulare]|uniref:Glycoside hydrolase superfamily n=1 Tax=Penicillium angulare TaxID=116970 RepID=UPI002540BB4B|nr:Glycoside hydrolase superfamily [Penicillium angulare]KAJ5256934.1 Glycoside hydrolase superfamily [Penicillium angulare]
MRAFLPTLLWVTTLSSLANSEFLSALQACPQECGDAVGDSSKWTHYSRVSRLAVCDETMLLDFAIHNPLRNSETPNKLLACTLKDGGNVHSDKSFSSCDSGNEIESFEASSDLVQSGENDFTDSDMVINTVRTLHYQLQEKSGCRAAVNFASRDEIVVGLYAGNQLERQSVAENFLPKIIEYLQEHSMPDRLALQHCAKDSAHTVGVVIDTAGDYAGVQEVVRDWSQATCPSDWNSKKEGWATVSLKASQEHPENATRSSKLATRDTCDYRTISSGDTCVSLAKDCGISADDFLKFNPENDFCTSITPGEAFCCSAGNKPNLRRKRDDDDTCKTYTTVTDDNCYDIAKANDITQKDIESWNKNTWGWTGCGSLGIKQIMCISKGDPPLPAELPNAVCGPQKLGTKKPTDGTKLADLNPCPIKACCNIWGQCGTTDDFCTVSESETGAPGTSANGTDGCISNCGTDISDGNTPLDEIKTIMYYEAWNYDRPCLNMEINDMVKYKGNFTHVHFAFAGITDDLEVNVSSVQSVFNDFKTIKDFKRIISFGGWSFSTEIDTYPIFRQGVTDAQRQKFADNVVKFVKDNDLDGVDFDWEYPGAPDIPDLPPGSKEDGANYVKFLKMVKKQMPDDKSLSVAMPASYWYLRGFDPLTDFADVVDYVIFMTYDLHGQWDYDNPSAVSGCPKGDCLRSHVNFTEVLDAMTMIQKGGMPAEKVIVGHSSYGRSFKMAEKGCTGPMCRYTGPKSGALPGRCTQTAGYLATAEINEIRANNPSHKSWFDKASYSDFLVYNDTEWVGYMSEDRKAERELLMIAAGWGGIVDWAIDLVDMYTHPSDEEIEVKLCTDNFDTLEDLAGAGNDVPEYCIDIYALQIMNSDFKTAMSTYNDLLDDGYDSKFDTYEDYINSTMYDELREYMVNHAEDRFHCVPSPCPDNLEPSTNGGQTYKFVLDDKEGFFKDIFDEYGIDESWIKFGELYAGVSSGGCRPTPDDPKACTMYHSGFPIRDNEHMKIPNPKETISGAYKNLTDFGDQLDDSAADAAWFMYADDVDDAVVAAELPLFLAESAVKQMQKVVDAADDIDAAEKKSFIVNFAASLLMLVPAVGESIGALGLATIGRVVTLAGDVGNAAFGVYGVVEDPQSAIFGVFGALIGVRGERGFSDAAESRRGMSEKEKSALGKYFQERTDQVDAVKKRTCPA